MVKSKKEEDDQVNKQESVFGLFKITLKEMCINSKAHGLSNTVESEILATRLF